LTLGIWCRYNIPGSNKGKNKKDSDTNDEKIDCPVISSKAKKCTKAKQGNRSTGQSYMVDSYFGARGSKYHFFFFFKQMICVNVISRKQFSDQSIFQVIKMRTNKTATSDPSNFVSMLTIGEKSNFPICFYFNKIFFQFTNSCRLTLRSYCVSLNRVGRPTCCFCSKERKRGFKFLI